jgi:Uma2 family endonuclease
VVHSAKESATYNDLLDVPENMIGEIVDGRLVVTPRPAPGHMNVVTILSEALGPPYRRGRGGPGGWIFLFETEIRLGEDIVVPDLSGWRKERFPAEFGHNWTAVTPDWICEVLPPGRFRNDKVRKMPLYARHGVGYAWIIDPVARAMDAFRLESARWSLPASFLENDKVRAEPFEEIEIALGDFWM